MKEYSIDTDGWIFEGKISEVKLSEKFLAKYPFACINGNLYEEDGTPVNEDELKRGIMKIITPYVSGSAPKRISNIIETMKITCSCEMPLLQQDNIHFANGTYLIREDRFSMQKEFTLNRLSVNYNASAPAPKVWLSFLNDLLGPDDILTLQEYMGYCYIPATRAQKMLLLIGKGGEGKSRIGIVMDSLFGPNLHFGSLAKLEADRFARADLVGKLVFFDDDMVMEALTETHIIKTIVTLEGCTDVEVKGKQSFQAPIYARLFAAGNGVLSSLHDRSDGFYRRQIIITTKDVPPDRVDDPFLSEKLIAEKEGIALWCIEGLKRLIKNNYRFTISDKSKKNLEEAREDGNNVMLFLKSEGYIGFNQTSTIPSTKLYRVYEIWCEENAYKPLSCKTFIGSIKDIGKAFGISYNNKISAEHGKKVRGFTGIHSMIRT